MAGRPGRDGQGDRDGGLVTAFFPPKQQSKQAGGGAGAGAADDTNAVRRKEVDVNGGGEQTRLGDSSSSNSSSTPSRTRVFPPHSLEFFRTVSPREPKRAKTKGGWGGASTHADKAKGPKSRPHRSAEPPIDRSVLGIDQKRVFDAIVRCVCAPLTAHTAHTDAHTHAPDRASVPRPLNTAAVLQSSLALEMLC
jgi:hypothetical protein